MRIILVLLSFLAGPALAQDWFHREGDVFFSENELAERLLGQTLVFFDDGQSHFADDETYSYTYLGGATANGSYKIFPESTVCISFANGFRRCDRIVENGGRLVLVTEEHLRFPVRDVIDGPPINIAAP